MNGEDRASGCLDDATIEAFVSGDSDQTERVLAHIDECSRCRELVAVLSRDASLFVDDVEATLLPGGRVGPYIVIGRLGRGGMGEVWSAADPRLDRTVALKVVASGTEARDANDRLLREAKTLGRLTHPHVVRVYDVGRFGDGVYVAMERLDGGTLDHWCRAQSRRWGDVVDRLVEAGMGLVAAHEAGVVHRDFKPQNVLISSDGRAVVTDFGLAVEHTTRPDARERRWTLAGTETYFAPELRDGAPPSFASDQYGYCVTFLELANRAPKRIRDVVARGTLADPRERFEDVAAVLAAIRQARRRSRPRVVMGGAAAVLSVAASGVWATQTPTTCEPAVQAVWTPDERAAVQAALQVSIEEPQVRAQTWRRLDGFADAWIRARGEGCGAPDPTTGAGQCLLGHRAEFQATTAWLLDPSNGVMAPEIVGHLRSPVECFQKTDSSAPVDAEHAAGVAEVAAGIGRVRAFFLQQRFDEAEALLPELEQLAERTGHASSRSAVALARASLYQRRADFGSLEEAAAHAAAVALEARNDDHLVIAWTMLLDVRVRVGTDHREGQNIRGWIEALIDSRPVSASARLSFVRELAVLAHQAGRDTEALEHYETAVELGAELLGSDHPRVASDRLSCAWIRSRQGNSSEATEEAFEALEVLELEYGRNSGFVRRSLGRVVDMLLEAGDVERARAYAERAATLARATLEPGHPGRSKSVHNLARIAASSRPPDYARALELFEEAKSGFAIRLESTHFAVVSSELNCIVMLIALKRLDEATTRVDRLLDGLPESSATQDQRRGQVVSVQAAVLFEQGRYAAAEEKAREAVALLTAPLGPDAQSVIVASLTSSRSRARLGHDERAALRQLLERSRAAAVPFETRAEVRRGLSEALWLQGQRTEARRTAEDLLVEVREAALPTLEQELSTWVTEHDVGTATPAAP